MKITNKLGLPQQLVNIIDTDYQPTDKQYSCTTILKPTRQIILERRYKDLIEMDVSDAVWMIFGIAVHSIIENSDEEEGQFKEEKLKLELGKLFKELEGYKISGRSDMIDLVHKKVHDWKTCSVWKITYQDFEDWRKETLIYAWILKQLGFEINSGEITAFIKDHNKTKAKTEPDYPQNPVYVKTFEFTDKDFEEIEQFIYNKFLELQANENIEDDKLPMCTAEERWNKGDTYAVKKKKNKTATKVHDNLESAEEHLKNLEYQYPNEYEIEIRKGEDKRCLEYCSCCKFCPYYLMNYDEDVKEIHNELVKETDKIIEERIGEM